MPTGDYLRVRGLHDERLSIVAIWVNNPDCSPLGING
jgi:hypothetical protein